MPLTTASTLMSFSLAAGEPFVVQMLVDGGLDADERQFVMSIYGPDRTVVHVIDGEQNDEDVFEFIRPGTWSQGLYPGTGLKIEVAERLKGGRAVIATGTLNIAASAETVEDFANGVQARSAVFVTVTFAQTGVVTVAAKPVAYAASATIPDPDPDPNPSTGTFGSITATWGSTLKFGATT